MTTLSTVYTSIFVVTKNFSSQEVSFIFSIVSTFSFNFVKIFLCSENNFSNAPTTSLPLLLTGKILPSASCFSGTPCLSNHALILRGPKPTSAS